MTLGSRSIITSMALLIAFTCSFVAWAWCRSFLGRFCFVEHLLTLFAEMPGHFFIDALKQCIAAGGGRGLKSRSFQLLWRNPSHIPPFPDPEIGRAHV